MLPNACIPLAPQPFLTTSCVEHSAAKLTKRALLASKGQDAASLEDVRSSESEAVAFIAGTPP